MSSNLGTDRLDAQYIRNYLSTCFWNCWAYDCSVIIALNEVPGGIDSTLHNHHVAKTGKLVQVILSCYIGYCNSLPIASDKASEQS